MKATPSTATACDIITSTRTLAEIFDYRDVWYKHKGVFSQDLLNLLASNIPMHPLFFKEDENGVYHAVGMYTNNVLATAFAYIEDGSDFTLNTRRVCSRQMATHIITNFNSSDSVYEFIRLLIKTGTITR